jgi:hypothetical protein
MILIFFSKWNLATPSPAGTIYLNQRMLKLSRITRCALAARLCYQRLRSRELDIMKSILEDEIEMCQSQLSGVDLQIGSLQNTLEVEGVTAMMGGTYSRLDPDNIRSLCESSSLAEEPVAIAASSRGSSACPQSDGSDA